jgi:hypothetical protein
MILERKPANIYDYWYYINIINYITKLKSRNGLKFIIFRKLTILYFAEYYKVNSNEIF